MNKRIVVLVPILLFASMGGVYASWSFSTTPTSMETTNKNVGVTISDSWSFGSKYTVKFYTSYSSGWAEGTATTINNIAEGSSISTGSIPTPSLSGYTFQGWVTNAPSSSNYTPTYANNSVVAALSITSNMTFYPLLKSNTKKAYISNTSSFHALSTDVTLSISTISSISIGDQYVGVTNGVCNASATSNSVNLLTASGIYKFSLDGSSVVINRKIGLRISDGYSSHWNQTDYECYTFWCFNSSTSKEDSAAAKVQRPNNGTIVCYYYIDYSYRTFIATRFDGGSNIWGWGDNNKSGDIQLINNSDYNSESKSSYTSTNYVLDKNKDWDSTWTGKWTNLTS